jgi:hypothetical protein
MSPSDSKSAGAMWRGCVSNAAFQGRADSQGLRIRKWAVEGEILQVLNGLLRCNMSFSDGRAGIRLARGKDSSFCC